jgi:hypothetical protein
MNRKSVFIIIAIIIFCIIVGSVVFFISIKVSSNQDQEFLDIIQGNPPVDYIDQLETLISTHPDPYVKENGIITLTEIALKKNESEKISGFLKDLALNATDESVRMTADTNYGLLRLKKPLPIKAEMKISLEGKIRKNSTITLIVNFTSTIENSNVRVDIPYIDNRIGLLSNRTVRFKAIANQSQIIKYSLNPREDGKYIIPIEYTMGFDRLDYEKVRKRVFLTVNQAGGSYFVI